MECLDCPEDGATPVSQLTISWSALRSFEECHMQQHLLRSGKKNPAANIRGYFHGTVVDRVMRDWLNDPEARPGDMPHMVRDIMDREELEAIATGDGVVRWKTLTDREETIAFCVELVTRLEPILYDLIIPYDFEPAKRFRVPVEIPYLDGRPTVIYLAGETDLIARRSPEWWECWDLKGTRDNSYWRKTVGQIVFYDISMHAMFGYHTSRAGLIQPMCDQRVLPIVVDDQARAELMQRVITFAHAIWKKDYAVREDMKYCTYCPVRHACPKFQPVEAGSKRLSLIGMKSLATQLEVVDLLGSSDST